VEKKGDIRYCRKVYVDRRCKLEMCSRRMSRNHVRILVPQKIHWLDTSIDIAFIISKYV